MCRNLLKFEFLSNSIQSQILNLVSKGKGLGKVNYSEQSQLKKSVARKYYRKTQKLIRSEPEFNHPGNIYYSLAAQENDNLLKVTWGDSEHPAPEQARILYQEITKILSVLSFTPKNTQ